MRGESALAARGTGSHPLWVAKWRRELADSPRCVGVARAADRRAGVLAGSNPARATGQNQPVRDAGGRSPGAALLWHSHSIDTARAADRDDSCEDWPRTRRAGFHRLLCVAHAGEASGRRDNAVSHLAGSQSPGPRSDQFSRASPPEGTHSPREGLCALGWLKEVREQEQMRSCAPAQAEADVPTPGAGSRPID